MGKKKKKKKAAAELRELLRLLAERVQVGDQVKDMYSGFDGTCIAITDWLYASGRQIMIKPNKLDKDGQLIEAQSFDEPQVELVKRLAPLAAAAAPPPVQERAGGPQDDCEKRVREHF